MTTSYDLAKHHRRSIRLRGYDFTRPGAYFVTLVAFRRECLFGGVGEEKISLNRFGEKVAAVWTNLPGHFTHVMLGEMCIMPNHVHAIILLTDDDGRGEASTQDLQDLETAYLADASPQHRMGTAPGSLGAIIQNFKSISTRKINHIRKSPGTPVWQRNYYEHIIRNDIEYRHIAKYIQDNPLSWGEDPENPSQRLE